MKKKAKMKELFLTITATLVTLLMSVAVVQGAPINISGTYDGAINGDAFTAISTGWLDPAAGSANMTVDFSHIPSGYNWQLPASCWLCLICCNGRLELAGALNLNSVTGSNYYTERTITYADDSQVTLSADVAMNEITNTIEYDVTWGGNCTIPVDNLDVDGIVWPVEERFTQLGPGQIRSYGTAEVSLIGGGTTPISFDGTLTYAGAGVLPFDEIAYMTSTQTFSGSPDYILNAVVDPGDSYILPEPATIALLGLGSLALLRRRRR